MKDNEQYGTYLALKNNHLKEINDNSISKEQREKIKSDFYKPILETLKATLNSNGMYKFNNFNCNISTGLAYKKGYSLQKIHNILEQYFFRKFKKSLKKKKVKLYKISFLYCCGCKKQTIAELYKQKGKYFFECECGLKVKTDNNPDFPNPIGNIPTEKMKGARKHLKTMLKSIIKKKIKTEVEVFLKVKNELGYWVGYEKSIQECRKVYKKIQDFINQDLINVKKII